MSTQTIIILVVVIAIIALLAARGGGPRVTQITRTVRKEKDSGDA
jgi:type II secretory pathway pseudopilin PulG